jgi:hypothetical protein
MASHKATLATRWQRGSMGAGPPSLARGLAGLVGAQALLGPLHVIEEF